MKKDHRGNQVVHPLEGVLLVRNESIVDNVRQPILVKIKKIRNIK